MFLAVCLAPLALPYAGGADEPARQGWWWQANPGQGAPAPPAPPDVPADGLYVQGGPNGPVALAAVLFELADGQTPKTLTLHAVSLQDAATSNSPAPPPAPLPTAPTAPSAPAPAPAAPPAPTIGACPIASGSFNVEQGGPIADAPSVADCSKPIAGTVDATANTITFDLSTLGSAPTTTLALALVPGAATDRVAFQKPGGDALLVDTTSSSDSASTSDSATATDNSFSADTSSSPAATGDLSSSVPSSPSLGYVPGEASTGAPVVAATPPAAAPAPAAATPAPAVRPRATTRPAVLAASKRTAGTRVGEFGAMALVVAALISYSRGYGLLGGKVAET